MVLDYELPPNCNIERGSYIRFNKMVGGKRFSKHLGSIEKSEDVIWNAYHECLTEINEQLKKGVTKHPLYRTWYQMIYRCENPKHRSYPYYGGMGVKVCERWKNDFMNFVVDMGPKPKGKFTVDRIDPNGNYEPSNCRWADLSTQSSNRRNVKAYYYDGVSMNLFQWAKTLDVDYDILFKHVTGGKTVRQALRAIRFKQQPQKGNDRR